MQTMICPKCKAEYRKGFYKCADCDINLLDELPSESPPEFTFADPVEVYSTYQQGEIAFVKSILEGEGIHFFFQGESPVLIGMAGSYARLFVDASDVDRVRDLLNAAEIAESENI
jgi:hypothetical protein